MPINREVNVCLATGGVQCLEGFQLLFSACFRFPLPTRSMIQGHGVAQRALAGLIQV
jgi:hypothetical protein